MNRKLKVGLAILGGVAALLVAAYLVENLRGRHAWRSWKRARLAAGDRIDPAAFAPPVLPEADNFAAAPLIAEAVQGRRPGPQVPSALGEPRLMGSWREGRRSDLAALKDTLKVQDLDAFLAPYGAELEALAEAARRPGCRLPVDYGAPMTAFPQWLGMRARARLLALRSLVRLEQGKSEAALEDVLTGLRVAGRLQREPHLITQLLRLAWANILLQPVWEGLEARCWSASQLERLQAALERVDLVASWRQAVLYEGCGSVSSFEAVVEKNAILGGWAYQNLVRMGGWWYQNAEVMDSVRHRFRPEAEEPLRRMLLARRTPYTFMLESLPAMLGQNQRMARTQSGLDQARVACALERFRLAKGSYPERLEALVPGFLPEAPGDVIEGQALCYTRFRPDAFRLYSPGWNRQDEGGRLVLEAGGRSDPGRGDWPWTGSQR